MNKKIISFFSIILGFAPWLIFLFIAHGSLFRLKLGLIIILILTIIMAVTKIHRGIISWAGLLFFPLVSMAVIIFNNMWVIKHIEIFASASLAIFTWLSIIVRKPFTIEYAKEKVDPSLWKSPIFLKINTIVTSAWGLTFTINTFLAWGKMEKFLLPEMAYEIINYILLVATSIFTVWYPDYVKGKAKAK